MVLGVAWAALQPPRPQWETSTEALFQNVFGHRAHSWTVCSANSTDPEQETGRDGAPQEASSVNRQLAYSNPLWPNGLDWMRLPPGTHLLLYGRSSIAGISSALRAGSEAYGVLERSVTVSAARDCADPTEDPRKHPQVTSCLYDCEAYMTIGPRELNVSTSADPHSVTVDYLKGGSTITTMSNHAQTQRLESRLDDNYQTRMLCGYDASLGLPGNDAFGLDAQFDVWPLLDVDDAALDELIGDFLSGSDESDVEFESIRVPG